MSANFLRVERCSSFPTGAPGDLIQPSTLYIVSTPGEPTLADIYFTGNTPVSGQLSVKHIIKKSEITDMISAAVASLSSIRIVPNIAARDLLVSTASGNIPVLTANGFVLVLDATADAPTATNGGVMTGAAMYLWSQSTASWTKVSEFESMDLQLYWQNIGDKPNMTPAQEAAEPITETKLISAITHDHQHSNKDVIDLITKDTSNEMLYNGDFPLARLSRADW